MSELLAAWRSSVNAPRSSQSLLFIAPTIAMGMLLSYLTKESLPLFASLLSVLMFTGLLSWLFVEFLRRFELSRSRWYSFGWSRIGLVAIVTWIAAVACSYAAYVLAKQWVSSDTPFGVGKFLFVLMHTLFAIAFVIAPRVVRDVYSLREANAAKRNAEQLRVATLERSLAMSELKTLQAQIEPHFLYNVLANVQSMIAHAPVTADAMLTHLIDYLKHALPSMRAGESTLRAELDLARSYLAIAQLRFGDRLSVAVNEGLDERATTLAMPPMLLLPLVENAIKHGVEGKPGAVHVEIDVKFSNETLTISVSDNGPGFKQTSGSGIGIANVRERLVALYRDRASVNIVPCEGGGVISTLSIPVIEKNAA
jgi:sensor histidine kinase YesM